jgi:hypothetical protein
MVMRIMKRSRNNRRGSLLITSLFLSIILLIMGVCFLTMKALQYQSGSLAGLSSRAGAIAEAGIMDAKLKLEKDLEFPRADSPADQTEFSYAENFFDLDGASRLGSYAVVIDTKKRVSPWYIIRITSIGTLGPLNQPLARRKIYAELDVSPQLRGNPSSPNPNYFRLINWQDSGSL